MKKSVILLVEDDPSTRRMMASALADLGVVLEAADGETALVVLREHAPHLVCVDLTLPEISGFAVCQAARKGAYAKTTRVVVVSGRNSLSDRAHAMEAGADAFIPKPFRLREVVQALTQHVQEARSMRDVAVVRSAVPAALRASLSKIATVAPPALRTTNLLGDPVVSFETANEVST